MQNPKGGCEGCGVGDAGQANFEGSGGGHPALLLPQCGVLLPLLQQHWHPIRAMTAIYQIAQVIN